MSMRAGMGRSGGGRRLEDPRELLEGGLQAVGQLALDVLLLRDVLEERGLPGPQEGVELPLITAALGNGEAVQVAVGGREDDDNLLLHGKGVVLVLLQDLGQAL